MSGWMITLSPAAEMRLQKASEETGRSIENLISSAAEEEALNYFRGRKDDPAEQFRREL